MYSYSEVTRIFNISLSFCLQRRLSGFSSLQCAKYCTQQLVNHPYKRTSQPDPESPLQFTHILSEKFVPDDLI